MLTFVNQAPLDDSAELKDDELPKAAETVTASEPWSLRTRRRRVLTEAGVFRVTDCGASPSEARLTILTVSNPGADHVVCYSGFLAHAASAGLLRSARVVHVDLPGLRPDGDDDDDDDDDAADLHPRKGSARHEALASTTSTDSFELLTSGLGSVVDQLGVSRVIMIASHMGARLALDLAASRPHLARTLLLGAPDGDGPSASERAWLGGLTRVMEWSDRLSPWARSALAAWYFPSRHAGTAAAAALALSSRLDDWSPRALAALLRGWSARGPCAPTDALTEALLRRGRTDVILCQHSMAGTGLPFTDVRCCGCAAVVASRVTYNVIGWRCREPGVQLPWTPSVERLE